MIEYTCIVSIALVQYLVYWALDKKSANFPKWLLLILLILAQAFIFPRILIWGYGLGENECGMPIFALHMFFLLFGGGLNIIVHFLYYLKTRLIKTV